MKKKNRGSHKQVETGCQETSGGSCVVSRFQSGRMCLFRVCIRIFFFGGAAGLFSGPVPDNLYAERTDRTTQTTAVVFLIGFLFYSFFVAG